jgi:hypothetical protein
MGNIPSRDVTRQKATPSEKPGSLFVGVDLRKPTAADIRNQSINPKPKAERKKQS